MHKAIAKALRLGSVLHTERVYGGYMHKLYRLQTTSGVYAVKLLNPEIMKRPAVFDNYAVAENLEDILQKNGLPVVTALEFNGKKMQKLDGQYFYVFDWINGRTLDDKEITSAHAGQIGALLATIHAIDKTDTPYTRQALCIDWDAYCALAGNSCPQIAALLCTNRELLYRLQAQANAAFPRVPGARCICNGDMDSKNVLWSDDKPHILDLECLQYGNPYTELFSLALSWCGCERQAIDYARLKAFLSAYFEVAGPVALDWEVLYAADCGRLEWLEYSLKRALRIECENEEEQALGEKQVSETLALVRYYAAVKAPLLQQLKTR